MKLIDIFEGSVVQGKFGGKSSTKIEKISMADAFGSKPYSIITKLGYKFYEKPDYWAELRREKKISALDLKKIEKELKKHGFPLNEYDARDIFKTSVPSDDERSSKTSPLMDIRPGIDDVCFIVKFPSGYRYLVDRTGASAYVRMWMFIDEGK